MSETEESGFDLKSYLASKRQLVNSALESCLQKFPCNSKMIEPVSYALSAGGKRVRPILCLAASGAVGGSHEGAMPAACALEMIHTYSLIHDDLPALDNDEYRRGKPTCHVRFSEATAILTGDALLNMAFETLSRAGIEAPCTTSSSQWLRVMNIIATASGCYGMIEGQARDLAYEGTKLDQPQLEEIHHMKTGALIKASVQAGAVLGSANETQIDGLVTYAGHIGLAFQVVDDILNVKGDPEVMGKAVGTDETRQKNTYPSLLGLEQAESYSRQLIADALKALDIFDNSADPLRAIANYIVDRNR